MNSTASLQLGEPCLTLFPRGSGGLLGISAPGDLIRCLLLAGFTVIHGGFFIRDPFWGTILIHLVAKLGATWPQNRPLKYRKPH